jgi:formate dehydrogenase major subunit
VRTLFEEAWGVTLQPEPGLRIPNMFDAALDGSFKGLYCQGEDIVQSDPNTHHVSAALSSMECIVVQDIFLNETAKYAHVLLPGSSFLEKDGTFTNAERRISRVRKVMPPLPGYADWEVTVMLARALGYEMDYAHPSRSWMRSRASRRPSTASRTRRLDQLGSIQWPCNETAPDGTPTMHIDTFVRGKGKFVITKFIASPEKVTRKFPLILTTGRILSQYNVGAQTRRTRTRAGTTRTGWKFIRTTPKSAASRWTTGSASNPRGQTVLRAKVTERMQPGVVYTTFHFPESGANVITTESSDWATNCPEYKVTAVQVMPVEQPSQWQQDYSRFNTEQLDLLRQRELANAASGK